jgi:hypothetical protein
MHEYRIPERIRQGLDRYYNDGVLPGSFLWAVLTNDLVSAVHRADPESYAALREIVLYVYNELPCECYGTQKKMLAWSDKKRAERLAREVEKEKDTVTASNQQ